MQMPSCVSSDLRSHKSFQQILTKPERQLKVFYRRQAEEVSLQMAAQGYSALVEDSTGVEQGKGGRRI